MTGVDSSFMVWNDAVTNPTLTLNLGTAGISTPSDYNMEFEVVELSIKYTFKIEIVDCGDSTGASFQANTFLAIDSEGT